MALTDIKTAETLKTKEQLATLIKQINEVGQA